MILISKTSKFYLKIVVALELIIYEIPRKINKLSFITFLKELCSST